MTVSTARLALRGHAWDTVRSLKKFLPQISQMNADALCRPCPATAEKQVVYLTTEDAEGHGMLRGTAD